MKRFLALILSLCMMFSMSVTAMATEQPEMPYGITPGEGYSFKVTQLTESEIADIVVEAKSQSYGVYVPNPNAPIGTLFQVGKCYSPFLLTSDQSYVELEMAYPKYEGYSLDELLETGALSCKVAVQDAGSKNAPVIFFPAEIKGAGEEKTISAKIPVGENGVKCALVFVTDLGMPNLNNHIDIKAEASDIYENEKGAICDYEWTLSITQASSSHPLEDVANKLTTGRDLTTVIQLELPKEMSFIEESFQVDSPFFEKGTVTQITNTAWELTLKVKDGFTDEDGYYTDAADEPLETPFTISYSARVNDGAFEGEKEVLSYAEIQMHNYHDILVSPSIHKISCATTPIIFSTMRSAVTITPADMTIYQGGDEGYEGVYDDGSMGSDSLPHPLFEITPASGSDVQPTEMTFTNDDKSWKVVGTKDSNLYYFEPVSGTKDPVRVTYSYTNENGEKVSVTNDEFEVGTDVQNTYAEYAIDLYPGNNDLSEVKAKADDSEWPISVNSGTLIVRAVEKETGATSDIVEVEPAEDGSVSYTENVPTGSAKAVAPSNTTYTLNDTEVQLPADHGASLLFDDIISSDGKGEERIEKLEAAAGTWLDENEGSTDGTRNYQIKYLDLVDAKNGNAWIKASNPVTIYWGYPEDTDQSTNFKLLHFKDLHRDTSGGDNTGFDPDHIAGSTIEKIEVANTENGISFTVNSGGFSPFVLVWETASTPDTYTITATAGNGGSISPSGAVTVNAGADQTFAITPNSGYRIADVTVDGASVGARNTYTFEDVDADHTINATFTYNGGGTITPDPTPDPDPEPTPDPDEPGIADPDDTGVADWLNTEDHEVFLNGYPDGSFGPDRSMTRAEVAAMFSNLLLDKNVPITTSFSDVAEDAWYADAVNMLASLDMIAGYEDGTFRPDAPITRAEFTAIAMRFADAAPEGENIFSDVHAGDWFYDVVVGSIQYGWIGGYEDGTFRPQNTITRAEVTAITNRMLGRVADEAFIDAADALRSFGDLSDAHWAYYSIMEATNAHDYTTTDGVEEWEALH